MMFIPLPGEGQNPVLLAKNWVLAFAGMTALIRNFHTLKSTVSPTANVP
jgi:hypothetical protein